MKVAVIPARGGSKRIPKKNIRDFCGKPIIAYSIEVAKRAELFDLIIVSTDDEEIAEVAENYGAEVPFMRPLELSNDFIGVTPVIKHTIEWIEKNKTMPQEICCIYATAPFVRKNAIQGGYKQLIETKADYCFSATSFPFPVQRAIKITSKNRVSMFYPEHFNTRSQDLEESYHDAGQFCWGKAQAFREGRSLFSENSSPYLLPRYLVQDIDTTEDWIRAELMYQVLKKSEALL